MPDAVGRLASVRAQIDRLPAQDTAGVLGSLREAFQLVYASALRLREAARDGRAFPSHEIQRTSAYCLAEVAKAPSLPSAPQDGHDGHDPPDLLVSEPGEVWDAVLDLTAALRAMLPMAMLSAVDPRDEAALEAADTSAETLGLYLCNPDNGLR